MNARARRRLLWAGSFVVLFGAVAPNALYVEHWPGLPWSQTVHTHQEVQRHAAHCHGGQESCSQEGAFGQALPIAETATLALIGGVLATVALNPLVAASTFSHRLRRPPRLIPV